MKKLILAIVFAQTFLLCYSQKNEFSINNLPHQNKVEILYKGKLLTAYRYIDSVYKPILFPVNTLGGTTVTRGYPLAPVPGEQTDHPHHTGIWLNYESVNGLDFWNNSNAIAADKKPRYGHIVHNEIISSSATKNAANLTTTATWFTNEKKPLLNELTQYKFEIINKNFAITRTTTLTALNEKVIFKDVKDGFFAIRVARELEQPSTAPATFVDIHGNATTVPATPDNSATGLYVASNGKTGDSVWSTKGPWVKLQGKKNGKNITIAMFDHPKNPGYPTYWHARGYGLFALNPLGRKIFSNGAEEMNLSLDPGKSVKFTYRIIIAEGKELSEKDMNELSFSFGAQ